MTKTKETGGTKKGIALAAVAVAAVLCALTLLFIQNVKTQLWEQSVNTIMESTRQGCMTLKVQLNHDFESMTTAAENIKQYSAEGGGSLEKMMSGYSQVENSVRLYLEDGTVIPEAAGNDTALENALAESSGEKGIIDPHISGVTGVNVFDLYVTVQMQDGTKGYLVKEYEVGSIVDSFSLSFYDDAGFSYIVSSAGKVLIRPAHPNSNKTVQNLFDMLTASENAPESLAEFAQALADLRTGWAVFQYQGEQTVFCYTPLKLDTDWYLISIIPQDVVNAQTNVILRRSLELIGSILLGISLLAAGYLWYAARARRRLRSQAAYTGHLYNAVPEAIGLITAEQPHRFLQLNREGLRLMGYPEGAPNNAPEGKLFKDAVYPEDYEKMVELFRHVSESGTKGVLEGRMLLEGGRYIWVAGIVEKMLDENGSPVLITAYHDITEKKLAEEEAKKVQQQERLTLVSAISNAYPVIININMTRDRINFVYVKKGLMLELGKQKTYSELYREMESTVHADHAEEFRSRFSPENLRRVLGNQRDEVFLEMKQRLEDGAYHWTSTQIIYVDSPYSQDKLAILISRRIDEQRYEEEQRRQAIQSALESARAASEAKGRFLSNMSHDIRTPMNAIVGMTAIAAAHSDDRERVAECLNKINLSSKHLLSLINDVLDVSKIESGKLSLREEPLNFAELTVEVVGLIRQEAEEKRIELDVRLSMLKNENVLGDSLRIRQVLLNILSNAVKYTPEGGQIHVWAGQESSSYKGYQNYSFRCGDTGIGMSEEFLTHLFEPFERARDSTTSKIAGTGLGMTITKNLVDLMNGEILVESRPEEGTVFTVTLPLKLQDIRQEEIPDEWKGRRCLIADDDRQTCENAVELFDALGLRAQFVLNGSDAVELVLQEAETSDPFSLIIFKRNLSDICGAKAAGLIREKLGPDAPESVLAAYDWTEAEKDAGEAGVSAVLIKPFYRARVCILLNELSGGKQLGEQKENAEHPDYTEKRILLAEDNEINREICTSLLEEFGAAIEEACDGAEALEKVSESEEGYYDLILMDIQMPNMDGYEAAKAIRALDRTDVKTVPIVAMTANAFEEDVRAALRAGMNAHFAKPVEMDTLRKILSDYLSDTAAKRK